MTDACTLTVAQASGAIAAGELSPLELVDAYLARIETAGPPLNAYATVTAERARADAEALTAELGRGAGRGPLHGIPIGLKDLIDTAGITTEAGSAAYRGRVPGTDAAVARRLREAGTVLLGKTTTHELAFGVTTDNAKAYGTTRNPWDLQRIPGGSSGGSAAATVAHLAAATIGTDTGGSIRIPAALCGCVGFKPTYGVVSRSGIAPLSWLLDHAGPIVRTVQDAALVLDAISGYDPDDEATAPGGIGPVAGSLAPADQLGGAPLRGLRIGVPRSTAWAVLQPGARAAASDALAVLAGLGAELVDVTLPDSDTITGDVFTLVSAESRLAHAGIWPDRYDDFGPDLQSLLAIPAPSGDTTIAILRSLAGYAQGVRRVLGEVDLLVSPTCPMVAPLVGERSVDVDGTAMTVIDAAVRNTVPYNLAHLPALSVPCGFADGLPVGLQLAGRPLDDALVLRVGHAYEQATEWHRQVPPAAS